MANNTDKELKFRKTACILEQFKEESIEEKVFCWKGTEILLP